MVVRKEDVITNVKGANTTSSISDGKKGVSWADVVRGKTGSEIG